MIPAMQDREWPQEAELVVCTVENVKDFVAFVSLDEYGGRQGLIPISEIATGWIKYIRDHIREGQKIVCKVLNVDRNRGHIDLSLKDVNEHQRREKIREWKNNSKALKWIGFASEVSGEPKDAITSALTQEYGDLYTAFEDIVLHADTNLKKLGLSRAVLEALVTIARGNVKLPKVTVTGTILWLGGHRLSGDNATTSAGGVVSTMRTVCVAVPVLLLSSRADHVTVVVPSGTRAGAWLPSPGVASQTSAAVACPMLTGVPDGPVHSAVIAGGGVTTGGFV